MNACKPKHPTAPLFLFCILGVAAYGARAGEVDRGGREVRLKAAARSIIETLEDRNPEERAYTIAVVPFPDAGTHLIRGVGVDLAQAIERELTGSRPDWLRIQNRMQLAQVLEEHDLSVMDIVRREDGAPPLPREFVEIAGLLVTGNISWRNDRVGIEWRVVVTRTNNVLKAGSITLDMEPTLWDRRRFINIPEGEGRVANVSAVEVEVRARRTGLFRGPKQWVVEDGGELQNRDRFSLQFSTDAHAYVYVLCYGSDGRGQVLYPLPREWREEGRFRPAPPFARALWVYTAPGRDREGTAHWYVLDNNPGRNVLYIVAHHEEVKDIWDIAARLGRAAGDDHRLEILRQAELDYVDTFVFNQVAPPEEDDEPN